jgi:hypothetical protein
LISLHVRALPAAGFDTHFKAAPFLRIDAIKLLLLGSTDGQIADPVEKSA